MATKTRAVPLSVAGLMYLFGHDVVPRDPAATEQTALPCLGAKVPTRPFAVQLVAGTLWSLSVQGAVTVELVGARLSNRDVLVTRAAGAEVDGRLAAGLANSVGSEPESVRTVVRSWAGTGAAAAVQVVNAARTDALRAGLLDRSGPRCREIEAYRNAFDELLAGWLTYRRLERETYDLVVAETRVVLGR